MPTSDTPIKSEAADKISIERSKTILFIGFVRFLPEEMSANKNENHSHL
ncbi:hypothetical protein B4135_2105 [Caldibacillus debilis]|uniref:Uncharacterized protein n=1 Tax=Caldibacillus debilis TaxID=301148 RepID=A0A150M441_9BACI|nr:hypothetical protein B4135_2105 [Caldibacillus debilis]